MTGPSSQSIHELTFQLDRPPGVDHREIRLMVPFGTLAFAGAVGSLVCCYVTILVGLFIGAEAADPADWLNPHVQAVVMWSLALLAVYALWRDRSHHSSNWPITLGAAAALILMATLYISYDTRFELLAYVLLVISALLNQNAFLGALNRKVEHQSRAIVELNEGLAEQVELQGREIGRLGQLKQFLSPQVADLVVTEGSERLLDIHRRYIACVFCDLRDFTSISESIEPEEVMAILQAYHEMVGGLVLHHNGTIGFRSGDGVMAFFNDPIPCDEPTLEATRLAVGIRESFGTIREPWERLGHPIGLGLGVASGYATLGLVGVRGRSDYTAIGGVVNVASRLCDRAADGEILMSQRAFLDVEGKVEAVPLGPMELKGVANSIEVWNLLSADADPKENRVP